MRIRRGGIYSTDVASIAVRVLCVIKNDKDFIEYEGTIIDKYTKRLIEVGRYKTLRVDVNSWKEIDFEPYNF